MTFKNNNNIWVFAYGSLIWKPDFDFVEAQPAILYGYHRAFCILSYLYRGSLDKPGLVLGLDIGGSCRGLAYRLPAKKSGQILSAIDAREMIYEVYEKRYCPIHLLQKSHQSKVVAKTYIANRRSPQYTGKLTQRETLKFIRQGKGSAGTDKNYLKNTVFHLAQIGLPDKPLEELLRSLDHYN